MKYRESKKDKTLRGWFNTDYSRRFLRKIELQEGNLRGINALNLSFEYPITAIAGRNGAGKSTILALACCAYHNNKNGFKPNKRNTTYYTFSDFFIQHAEETPPQGIKIKYTFALDYLKKTELRPEGKGLAYQIRHKKTGGRWNDYADRVKKNVIFLGIDRIVPHSERSQSKSYSRAFKTAPTRGWENKVKNCVGSIINKNYDEYRHLEYHKYNLPIVKSGETIYSGFNMGAGENALFEIFSTIYSAGEGSLIVVDEIELGLHSEAQRKLLEKLKDVCIETKTQIICTTHSRDVFDSLPNEARIYIESVNGNTKITNPISSEFAFSKLSGGLNKELEIFVEDDVAKTLLFSALPAHIRSRVTIKIIGSASAISRQLAASYIRYADKPLLAIFDGDQRTKENDNLSHAKNMAEKVNPDFDDWFKKNITYLPGDTWPEAWLIQKSENILENLSIAIGADSDALKDFLEYSLQAGKHNEFYELAKHSGLDRNHCLQIVTAQVSQSFSIELQPLVQKIEHLLAAS